jgi:argonaute-like protein
MAFERQSGLASERRDPGARQTRNLLLNIAPVSFAEAEVPAGFLRYESADQLRGLRKEHGRDHLFRRFTMRPNGRGKPEQTIQVIRLDARQPALGSSFELLRLSEHLPLYRDLVRNALISHFAAMGREVIDFAPVELISNHPGDDFLKSAAGDLPCPEWLSVKPVYELDLRVFRVGKAEPFVGVAVNVRTRKRILATCDVLLQANIDLMGLYVSRERERTDHRVVPRWDLIGRIVKIEGDRLILEDARDGVTELAAHSARIETRHDGFQRCLKQVFGKSAPRIEGFLQNDLSASRLGPVRLEKIEKLLDYLGGRSLELLPKVIFSFQRFFEEGTHSRPVRSAEADEKTDRLMAQMRNDRAFPPVIKAPPSTFVFDPTGTKTDAFKPRGLDLYGPYTSETFTPSRPKICVICQADRRGEVEQFLGKFKDGITPGTGKWPPFKKGLVRGYGLEGLEMKFFEAHGVTASAYQKAVQQALEAQGDGEFRWDLAMVQTDESSHELYGDQNPYLTTKASFLSQQIAVQEFEAETMDYHGIQLEYTLSNMALATYSKLGGIPWLLKSDPTIAHELVIGLGSCYVSDGRLGERQRIVGVVSMFNGSGMYFVSSLSKAVPIEEYQSALLNALEAGIKKARKDMNWQKGDHMRLIFHSFKPMKNAEADAVKDLASQLKDFDVEYAFLHVAENHPFLVFDTGQPGVWDRETKKTKGIFAAPRGHYIRISDRDILLALTGPDEVKKPSDGMPRPILLKLHSQSTFTDMTYLSRQTFNFANHSWRSFLPASMPITISYSQQIARLLGNLALLPKWNPDVMLGRLVRSRWFL